MSDNEIAAASQVQLDEFNAQLQSELTWDPSFSVVGSYYEQGVRAGTLSGKNATKVGQFIDKAETLAAKGQTASAIDQLNNALKALGSSHPALQDAIRDLIGTLE